MSHNPHLRGFTSATPIRARWEGPASITQHCERHQTCLGAEKNDLHNKEIINFLDRNHRSMGRDRRFTLIAAICSICLSLCWCLSKIEEMQHISRLAPRVGWFACNCPPCTLRSQLLHATPGHFRYHGLSIWCTGFLGSRGSQTFGFGRYLTSYTTGGFRCAL